MVTDLNTNVGDGGFDNASVTGMIFASARFSNGQAPFNREEASNKTYVSVYDDTLYIELAGRFLSVGAGMKKLCAKIALRFTKV